MAMLTRGATDGKQSTRRPAAQGLAALARVRIGRLSCVQMRLSFVIPTRNQARFIRKCIDSCLAQAIPDSEIMVVDGLSTDGTQEILASYGDRIRWLSEKDRGQSDALNKGVRQTSGEVIAWINSDDYYPTGNVLGEAL